MEPRNDDSRAGSAKYRIAPPSTGSAKYAVDPAPAQPAPRKSPRVILPWVLTAVMAAVMLAMLLPQFISQLPATDVPTHSPQITSVSAAQLSEVPAKSALLTAAPTATFSVSPTPTPSAAPISIAKDVRMTLTDGTLTVSWNGTTGDYLVRAMDTGDSLPDESVYEEIQTASRSTTLLNILPGHTYDICIFPADFSCDGPWTVRTSYSVGAAVPLGKYSLQLKAVDFWHYTPGTQIAQTRSSAEGCYASQIAQWLRTGAKAFALHLELSHQHLNNNQAVHYVLEFKAPSGATYAMSAAGTLLTGSGESTSCVFDCTDAMNALLDNGYLTPGWYTVSLNINGKHAVKTSFLLN